MISWYCDRCGLIDPSVDVFEECPVCGPVQLCEDCAALHLVEINEDLV